MVQKIDLPYIVKSVRLCGGGYSTKCEVELELIYTHPLLLHMLPPIQTSDYEEGLKQCQQLVSAIGYPTSVTIYHNAVRHNVQINQPVSVSLVYEDVPFRDSAGQEKIYYKEVKHQELLPLS